MKKGFASFLFSRFPIFQLLEMNIIVFLTLLDNYMGGYKNAAGVAEQTSSKYHLATSAGGC